MHRKTAAAEGPTNIIVTVILEILGDGLRLKARVLPTTLKAMLEVSLYHLRRFEGSHFL